jgi:RNA polymerase sigma-70 factor (ECF subfamily)
MHIAPYGRLYVGRDAVVNDWIESGFEGMKGLRAVRTCVNRQPAVPSTSGGRAITEIVTFHDDRFPRLGLPERLPAGGTE